MMRKCEGMGRSRDAKFASHKVESGGGGGGGRGGDLLGMGMLRKRREGGGASGLAHLRRTTDGTYVIFWIMLRVSDTRSGVRQCPPRLMTIAVLLYTVPEARYLNNPTLAVWGGRCVGREVNYRIDGIFCELIHQKL